MSIIGSILFFIIFVFFIVVGIGFYVLNSVFRLFGIGKYSHKDQNNNNNNSQSPDEEATQNMTGKKKIFDKDEGEYVDFEEEKK